MTVFWNVDDLKVSHKDEFDITRFATYLREIHGGLQASHGKFYDYLGMTLDYSDKDRIQVSMIPYLINILKDFPEDLGAPAATPAPDNLFKVRPEVEAIFVPEYQDQVFHHNVAQIIFLSARSRRYIQKSIALLITRVKKPDEDDWFKLRRCLNYLKGTIGLKLTLTADELSVVK